MRCTSPTPASTSISRTSKSARAPTAPNTVCRAPVLRCTSKPISTRRAITCWICSSLADSCMATIISSSRFSVAVLRYSVPGTQFILGLEMAISNYTITQFRSYTIIQWPNDPMTQFLIVHFNIELCFALGCGGLGLNFFFLQRAHDVNNALKNVLQLMIGQRPTIEGTHILKNFLFPFRLVDGYLGVALEAANFLGRARALVQQLDHLAVKLVNFLSPICDIHGFIQRNGVQEWDNQPFQCSTFNERKVCIVS